MSQTARYESPAFTASATQVRRYKNGVQIHAVSVWDSGTGDEVIALELSTYRGEIVNIKVMETDQLKLY